MHEGLDLAAEAELIRAFAAEHGQVLFDALPSGAGFTAWHLGNWTDFLCTAQAMGAKLIYLQTTLFTVHSVVDELAGDPDVVRAVTATLRLGPEANGVEGGEVRGDAVEGALGAAIAAYAPELLQAEGVPKGIFLSWAHAGVMHHWCNSSAVSDAEDAAIDRIRKHFEEVRATTRQEQGNQAEVVAEERARALATHPRWPEATNPERRQFLAKHLFPELSAYALQGIVKQAQAFTWWGAGAPESEI